jgi:hypothetical protein
LFEDGSGTWDPVAWYDWIKSLETIQPITKLEAFVAMERFLESYYKRTSCVSNDIKMLLESM